MLNISLSKKDYPYSFTEEIKQLRTNIEYSGADTKIILFTSATASEGKSTLSYELSRSFAEMGKNVLLIDTDMRRASLHTRITSGGQKLHGLSYFLSGQSDLANILYSTDVNNLYCIFAGRVPPNPTELLSSKRMERLVSWARDNFDYIFFDCPPVNLVADASILASYSDGAIMIIKSGSIRKRDAQDAIKQIERTECPIIGVVLNQVKTSSKGYYKKYGGYYGRAEYKR